MAQISARREAKSHAAQQHWLAERLLDRSAFGTTHLRPTFFAEWLKWQWLRNDHDGVLQLPFGNGRHAPIAGIDQANVIAAVLQNPAPTTVRSTRSSAPKNSTTTPSWTKIADTLGRRGAGESLTELHEIAAV
jgi:uncharacterized protein YbjT (DUF2867 family)